MNVGHAFILEVFFESRTYRIKVKCKYVSNQIERYWITGGKKLLVVRNNRPLAKAESKKAIIQWKVEDGYPNNPTAFYYTLRLLEQELDKIDGF